MHISGFPGENMNQSYYLAKKLLTNQLKENEHVIITMLNVVFLTHADSLIFRIFKGIVINFFKSHVAESV